MLHIILMHTSLFMLFLLMLLLAVYLFLDQGSDVDKKQIRAVFLFKFKMGHKAVETTRNVNNLAQKQLTNTLQWRFKKFCKGDESLENEEHSGWPSEVNNDQLRAIIKADPLTIIHSMLIQYLKQIRKVKRLYQWVPHELTGNQKNCRF